uniref:Putative dna polymerase delta catalytic subunit n=1 Tax=Ixodes ricinus TaxID=34613 RepID=A0A0K8RA20_IXORI
MRLLGGVFPVILGQFLRDHQLRDVHSVAEEVGNRLLRKRHSPVGIPVNENLLKAGVNEVGHKGAVVPADGLDALAVHLVVCVRPRVEQPGVALLVDQQVREVGLLELEVDGAHNLLRHKSAASRPSSMAFSRESTPKRIMTESVSP